MRLGNRTWRMCSTAMGALVAGLLVPACGSADKAPAEAAIKAAEAALTAVRSDAAKFAPDQLKPLDDGLAAAKANYEKGDYAAALGGAKDLAAKAGDLSSAIAAKRAELTRTWADVSAGVPKMAEAIQSRVDILSQSKKLPAGLDKDKLEGAKAGLATLKQSWADASAAYSAGNLGDAVTKATTAKDKAVETMTALNMQVPPAAKP
jgi:hypothetical protein